MPDNLDDARDKIDKIDNEILNLLDKRAKLALDTSVFKKKLGAKNVFDSSRELNVLKKVAAADEFILSKKDRADIFKAIMRACRNIQYMQLDSKGDKKLNSKVMRISVQGDLGSHSQQAAISYFAPLGINYELLFSLTSANVVADLCEGRADMGVFAISNSNAGLVNETLEAFLSAKGDNKVYNKLKLVEYFLMPVQHALMSLPDVNIETISAVYSHPQGLGQCKQYLANNFPNAILCECEDTAKAARDLSEGVLANFKHDLKSVAVIANEVCQEHYNLKILDNKIQDDQTNATGFLVVKLAN